MDHSLPLTGLVWDEPSKLCAAHGCHVHPVPSTSKRGAVVDSAETPGWSLLVPVVAGTLLLG